MSGPNSNAMTVEELIVQRLKGDSLMAVVGDEDVLTRLAERAIREALFQPRTAGSGSQQKTVAAPVVEAARELAREVIQKALAAVLEDPEAVKAIRDAAIDALPDAIRGWANMAATQAIDRASAASVERVIDLKRRNYPGL